MRRDAAPVRKRDTRQTLTEQIQVQIEYAGEIFLRFSHYVVVAFELKVAAARYGRICQHGKIRAAHVVQILVPFVSVPVRFQLNVSLSLRDSRFNFVGRRGAAAAPRARLVFWFVFHVL